MQQPPETTPSLPLPQIPEALHIEVTKDDVLYGRQHDGEHCPVARAVVRTLRGTVRHLDLSQVDVRPTHVVVRLGRQWVQYDLPRNVRRAIWLYDHLHWFPRGARKAVLQAKPKA